MLLLGRRSKSTGAVSQENATTATSNVNQNLVVTAFWEVNSGEEGAVAALPAAGASRNRCFGESPSRRGHLKPPLGREMTHLQT
jgi:hypothetical protein